MKLTKALKEWLSKNCSVPAEASDDDFRKAAMAAIAGGQLTTDKLYELSKEAASEPSMDQKMLDFMEKQSKTLDAMSAELKTLKAPAAAETKVADEKPAGGTAGDTVPAAAGDDQYATIAKSVATGMADGMRTAFGTLNQHQQPQTQFAEDGPTPVKLFTLSDEGVQTPKDARIRIKSAAERYSTTCTKAIYPETSKHVGMRGKQAYSGENGHYLDHPSQLAKAINGAWFKFMVNSACRKKGNSVPKCYKMSEHDNALVQYALHEIPFIGAANVSTSDEIPQYAFRGDRKMTDIEIKAVLDDSTSGGLEAAPIVFDDALILTPILFGEIFPLVNVVNLTRGRRVEGFSMGNPTITSGTAEGTSIALFNTASFIAAFDTTIFNAVGAIELGKDFEDDSPTNIGEQVMQTYGEAMLAWLDEQIVIGDGTTEPEGLTVASGTVSVASDNGTTGPPTLGDYEGLLFAVAKKFKPPQDRMRTVFISSETSYARSRGMKVDPSATSTDERRLLGLDHENYMTLGHPHKISELLANTKVLFANMRRYRMYRRLGTTINIEEGGKELVLKNVRLIVLRARYGGHLEDGDACGLTTDAQT